MLQALIVRRFNVGLGPIVAPSQLPSTRSTCPQAAHGLTGHVARPLLARDALQRRAHAYRRRSGSSLRLPGMSAECATGAPDRVLSGLPARAEPPAGGGGAPAPGRRAARARSSGAAGDRRPRSAAGGPVLTRRESYGSADAGPNPSTVLLGGHCGRSA